MLMPYADIFTIIFAAADAADFSPILLVPPLAPMIFAATLPCFLRHDFLFAA